MHEHEIVSVKFPVIERKEKELLTILSEIFIEFTVNWLCETKARPYTKQ